MLRAVVSQRLVKRSDAEGRVPAVEVMINTAYIRECILVPEKTRAVRDAISAGTSQYGMQTFDQSLWDLVPGRADLLRNRSGKRFQRRRLQAAHAGRLFDQRHFTQRHAGNRLRRRLKAIASRMNFSG